MAGVGAVMLAAFGRSAPTIPDNIDPVVYHRLITAMRDGGGFYRSIDEQFRAHGMGPVDSVLAIRSPLGFWLLTLAGSDLAAWILLVVAATGAAVLMARVLHRPLYAALIVVFFVMVGQVAWTAPELWASILVVAAVALALDERWLSAVVLATVATSLRELAVLVLVGLVLSRLRHGRAIAAPIAGLALATVFYLVHWDQVRPFLVRAGDGRQANLLGTGSLPGGALAMMSTWIPAGVIVGPLLFLAALAWAHRREKLLLLVPVLGLVSTGVLVDRPEWATFVVPFTLTLGLDEVDLRIGRRLSSRSPASSSKRPIGPVSAG